MYGISNAVMEANSLHGQIELERENRLNDYNKRLNEFHDTIRKTKQGDNTETDKDTAENVGDVQDVITSGKGIYGGLAGAGAGARDAYSVARSGITPSTFVGETDASGALTEASQSAFLAESAGVANEAQQGAGVARSALAGVRGAGSGFVSGVDEAFGGSKLPTALGGEGLVGFDTFKTAEAGGQGLSGVEGIVQKGIVKLGGGEDLGVVAGKGAGAVGGFIDAGEQIDSLVQTGGKSMFTRVDAQGNRVAMSGTDKASEILTEAGSALDVASAFTGGLLVPLAGAVSLAGAITGIIGDYEDQKADNKKVGINADGSTDASKAPKLSDTALPQGEAFTSLGFIGNMSHNPLTSI